MNIHNFITVAEAAQRLRVSDDAVRTWIKNGRLHAQRVGRRFLLNPDEVNAMVIEVQP